jgi:S1-C subfamily serine protease
VGERAGLRDGDLIVRAGEREVTSVDVLHEVLTLMGPTDGALELLVVRGVEEVPLVATFAPADDEAAT